jgi:mannitol/fructose-specific phosphotransferase system IIA component (Ntr-type)
LENSKQDNVFIRIVKLLVLKRKVKELGDGAYSPEEKEQSSLVSTIIKNGILIPHLAPITALFNFC